MLDVPTISELFKAKAITAEQIDAAVGAVLAGETEGAFPIADGYVVWLAAAVQAYPPAAWALADPDAGQAFKRTIVRAAIVLAGAVPDADGKVTFVAPPPG